MSNKKNLKKEFVLKSFFNIFKNFKKYPRFGDFLSVKFDSNNMSYDWSRACDLASFSHETLIAKLKLLCVTLYINAIGKFSMFSFLIFRMSQCKINQITVYFFTKFYVCPKTTSHFIQCEVIEQFYAIEYLFLCFGSNREIWLYRTRKDGKIVSAFFCGKLISLEGWNDTYVHTCKYEEKSVQITSENVTSEI